jgi:6-phosphogluconate dehydrogenase (decarboxylating)
MLLKDETTIKFQLDGARSLYGLTTANKYALDTLDGNNQHLSKELNVVHSLGNNLLFHDKRIVIIDSIPTIKGKCTKLKVDYLVIKNNPKFRINDLQQLYQPECIIIDGTNSFYKTTKYMAEFKKAGLKAYSVKNSGAYIVDL